MLAQLPTMPVDGMDWRCRPHWSGSALRQWSVCRYDGVFGRRMLNRKATTIITVT